MRFCAASPMLKRVHRTVLADALRKPRSPIRIGRRLHHRIRSHCSANRLRSRSLHYYIQSAACNWYRFVWITLSENRWCCLHQNMTTAKRNNIKCSYVSRFAFAPCVCEWLCLRVINISYSLFVVCAVRYFRRVLIRCTLHSQAESSGCVALSNSILVCDR